MARLAALGYVLGPAMTQEDVVYAERAGSIEEFLSNQVFLRIRVTGNRKVIFTVKYHPGHGIRSDDSAPVELELEISSREEMEKILAVQGYTEIVRVKKTRQSGKLDGMEVCIDEVDRLGSFIELERLAPEGANVKEVQDELISFLMSLGIADTEVTRGRYDIMMLQLDA